MIKEWKQTHILIVNGVRKEVMEIDLGYFRKLKRNAYETHEDTKNERPGYLVIGDTWHDMARGKRLRDIELIKI